jgi:hypothetical protein
MTNFGFNFHYSGIILTSSMYSEYVDATQPPHAGNWKVSEDGDWYLEWGQRRSWRKNAEGGREVYYTEGREWCRTGRTEAKKRAMAAARDVVSAEKRAKMDVEHTQKWESAPEVEAFMKAKSSVICKYSTSKVLGSRVLFGQIRSFMSLEKVSLHQKGLCCLCTSLFLSTRPECRGCGVAMHTKCRSNYIREWKAARADVNKATRPYGQKKTNQELINAGTYSHPECPKCGEELFKTRGSRAGN